MSITRVFAGFEPQESDGFAVFMHSLITRASCPLAVTPLATMGLPRGTNSFTLSRFLVPYLCDFQGHAIFLDGSDMLMQADIAELDSLFNPAVAVQVVKHPDYRTLHPHKYVGTPMECVNSEYNRKNWMSAAIFNCAHPAWRAIGDLSGGFQALPLLRLAFLRPGEIGELPAEWNVLADEGQPIEGAKILHWTAGLPSHDAYAGSPAADLWRAEAAKIR